MNRYLPMKERIFRSIKGQGVAGYTCDDIEALHGFRHQSASARIRELVSEGRIRPSGKKRPTRGGVLARVYEAI